MKGWWSGVLWSLRPSGFCHWCDAKLPWYHRMTYVHACGACAARMSRGGHPTHRNRKTTPVKGWPFDRDTV